MQLVHAILKRVESRVRLEDVRLAYDTIHSFVRNGRVVVRLRAYTQCTVVATRPPKGEGTLGLTVESDGSRTYIRAFSGSTYVVVL